jgi:hypothetical protein
VELTNSERKLLLEEPTLQGGEAGGHPPTEVPEVLTSPPPTTNSWMEQTTGIEFGSTNGYYPFK